MGPPVRRVGPQPSFKTRARVARRVRRNTPEWREAGGLYRRLHRIGRRLVKGAFRLHLRGRENIPESGPVILVPNHHSWADGLVTAAVCPRPIRFIGKAELFRRKSWAAFFRAANVVPVDREKDDGTRTTYLGAGGNANAFRAATENLEAGRVVALYPEGTLRPPTARGPYKSGAGALALLTGAPVVPVGEVTHIFWPGYAWIPRFGRRTHVSIGPPLRFPKDPEAAADRARAQAVTEEIMQAVYREWEAALAARSSRVAWRWR